jgi:hypothetical protein
MSGSPIERENEQQDAGQSQSSCSIRKIARELAAMGYTNKRGAHRTRRHASQGSRTVECGSGAGPVRPASRELTTFALVSWRSAYVPPGKAESARALPSRIRCVLRHRRKRPHKLGGINCVAATIELTGREPATFDCPVDRRFGNACSPCCAVWCVHARYQCVALETCCYVPMQSLRPG